jgi:DNA-binding LacI/PurR family transcriptional regulator
VLAGVGNPRPSTAAAVIAAAEALDYRPSGVARSLRTRETRSLGLIVTDIQNPFFPELVQAADIAARANGYSILLGSAAYDETRAQHYMDVMVDRRVDGMIIASSQIGPASVAWLRAAPIPVVIVNAEPGELAATVITSDNRGGSRLAAEHLIALGHRRIAYIRGAESYTADRPRFEGFRDACRAAGLGADDLVELRGDGQFAGGERTAIELVEHGLPVTAIACYNDLTAIGVLHALRDHGVRVPLDVSVIGCDDIAASTWVVPALTTISQQKADLGRIAVERLAGALRGDGDARAREVVRLSMSLCVRESTGPPPGDRVSTTGSAA